MHIIFQIRESIYLVAGGSEHDLHNDFDFVGYEYRPAERGARLSWRRSEGDWMPKASPARITLGFTGVSNFSVRRRDEAMPFSEDCCMVSMSFAPPDYSADFEAVLEGFRGADEHLSIIFQSRAALKIWAESATHEIERG